MSHGKIRTEKVCLNCGTETPGSYCPNCGQLNLEPKQSVWQLVSHFFSDITHFDGKFFLTVKDLIIKPGFLSREYMIGRRASYLDPIRMYVFTSAFFFLVFFSIADVKHIHFEEGDKAKIRDSIWTTQIHDLQHQDSVKTIQYYTDTLKSKSPVTVSFDSSGKKKRGLYIADKEFNTVAAYDSAQKAKPTAERDGWFKRSLERKKIDLNNRMEKEKGSLLQEGLEIFLHSFPKILFIFLPVFALILKLLYIRKKNFYYTDHGIFSIHLFVFSFLYMLVLFGLFALKSRFDSGLLGFIIFLFIVYPFIYYYKAMRRFYGQSRGKTFLKYSLLFLISFILMGLMFVAAIGYTVYEV